MENPKVYKSRWWIVFIFSLYSAAQSIIWLTFSPIADDGKRLWVDIGDFFFYVRMLCLQLYGCI
jgi:hypothetical protein